MWECENCKADVKDDLEVCWNCGNDRKGANLVPNTEELIVHDEDSDIDDQDSFEDYRIDVKSLEATRLLRFFNCLIDSVLIIIIIISIGVDSYYIIPLIFFIYYFLLESILGVTIGKMFTRTRVVNSLGIRPHFFTIFVRTLCRFIPLDPWTFGTPGGGWHDNFSSTFVISNRLRQIQE